MQPRTAQRRQALCAPAALRTSAPAKRSVAVRAAVCTEENAGDVAWNKTYYPKMVDAAKVEKDWFIIDAEGQRLGRLASLAAKYIRGKHTPAYTPSMDMGAYVIVINAEKVIMTGDKENQKEYKRHVNGLPGSMKVETFKQLQQRLPERIIEKAVHGMLPKGRLGRRIKLNLKAFLDALELWDVCTVKAFKGTSHPHEAQQPVDITDKIDGRF